MNDREIREQLAREMQSVTASPGLVARTKSGFSAGRGHARVRMALSVAVAAVVLVASAFGAERMGLLDFLGGRRVPDGAEEAVQRNVATASAEGVTATVREAVVSGDAAYLLIDITPREGMLLLPQDAEMDDPMFNLTGESSGTIGECYRAGRFDSAWSVTPASVGDAEGKGSVSQTNGRLLGGVYTMYVLYALPAPGGEAELTVRLDRILPEGAERIEIPLACALSPAPEGERASGAARLSVPGCGVAVTEVTLERLALETQVTVTFVVRDAESYAATEGGLWFRALDARGEELPAGARGEGRVELVSGADGEEGAVYRETVSVYLAEMPDSVMLEAYNCWEKNVYGTVSVPIG